MLRRAIVGIGSAGHQDDRQVLGVGACDCIDRRKSADAESDYRRSRTTCSGVSFGAVATIQFVAAVDLFQVFIGQKLIEQDEVKVAYDRKMML
jgi:hypothetical protein